MARFEQISEEEAREIYGGGKIYRCPWNDYRSTNFWTTYGHSIKCAYKHNLFAIPKALIVKAIKLQFGL